MGYSLLNQGIWSFSNLGIRGHCIHADLGDNNLGCQSHDLCTDCVLLRPNDQGWLLSGPSRLRHHSCRPITRGRYLRPSIAASRAVAAKDQHAEEGGRRRDIPARELVRITLGHYCFSSGTEEHWLMPHPQRLRRLCHPHYRDPQVRPLGRDLHSGLRGHVDHARAGRRHRQRQPAPARASVPQLLCQQGQHDGQLVRHVKGHDLADRRHEGQPARLPERWAREHHQDQCFLA